MAMVYIFYRGFSHGVITFTTKIYQGMWKTAAMSDYNEMVASVAISANAKRHFRMLLVCVESGEISPLCEF